MVNTNTKLNWPKEDVILMLFIEIVGINFSTESNLLTILYTSN